MGIKFNKSLIFINLRGLDKKMYTVFFRQQVIYIFYSRFPLATKILLSPL